MRGFCRRLQRFRGAQRHRHTQPRATNMFLHSALRYCGLWQPFPVSRTLPPAAFCVFRIAPVCGFRVFPMVGCVKERL